jgi:NAD(P)-dependent dehydrogenase (short-subunit alcohol dehydrogenase family)
VSSPNPFRYDGKNVLVVGGATGMGAAAADIAATLGGNVTVLDYAFTSGSTHKGFKVDLREVSQVDSALAKVDGPVDAVVSAAGVADGTPGIMRVNFIGHRHIIDTLVDDGRLARGSAVCMISSVAGMGWERQLGTLNEFLATPGYEAAAGWIAAHEGTDNYIFSKQAMNCYVAARSFPLMSKGIRINAVCPAPTDTPLGQANADMWFAFGQDYRDASATKLLTPADVGHVITFLNSEAAVGVSGINLLIDQGYLYSSLAGSYEPGALIASMVFGQA